MVGYQVRKMEKLKSSNIRFIFLINKQDEKKEKLQLYLTETFGKYKLTLISEGKKEVKIISEKRATELMEKYREK